MVISRKQFLNTIVRRRSPMPANAGMRKSFPNPTRAALAVYTDSYMGMARAGRKIGDAFPPRFSAKILLRFYGDVVVFEVLS